MLKPLSKLTQEQVAVFKACYACSPTPREASGFRQFSLGHIRPEHLDAALTSAVEGTLEKRGIDPTKREAVIAAARSAGVQFEDHYPGGRT